MSLGNERHNRVGFDEWIMMVMVWRFDSSSMMSFFSELQKEEEECER